MSTNIFSQLQKLLPPSTVLIGTVLDINEDEDYSTIELVTQQGDSEYAAGIVTGARIRARGTFVPVGEKAFVRDGVIETRAPAEPPIEIVVGTVVVPPDALVFNGPIADQELAEGDAFTLALASFWTGGKAPLSWSVGSGALPAGVTLNPSTGVVSGTPTEDGEFSVRFRATDMLGFRADSNVVAFDVAALAVPRIVRKASYGGGVSYSDDGGATFSAAGSAIAGGASFAYGSGVFAMAQEGLSSANAIQTSPDGVTWTQRSAPSANTLEKMVFGNGAFVATRYDGGTGFVDVSTDGGVTWTARALPAGPGVGYIQSLSFAVDLFLCTPYLDSEGEQALTGGAISSDGVTWTFKSVPALDGGDGFMLQAGALMKVGSMYVLVSSGDLCDKFVTTSDFSTFTPRTAAFPIACYRQTNPVFAFGKWFVSRSGGVAYTSDGTTFVAGLSGDWILNFDGTRLIAHGAAGVRHSTDGVTWTSVSATNVGLAPWGVAV